MDVSLIADVSIKSDAAYGTMKIVGRCTVR